MLNLAFLQVQSQLNPPVCTTVLHKQTQNERPYFKTYTDTQFFFVSVEKEIAQNALGELLQKVFPVAASRGVSDGDGHP